MNKQLTWKFAVVAGLIALAVYSLMTNGIRLGLDLKGGTSFLLQMDLSKTEAINRGQVREQAIEIIGRRVDRFGVAEPSIQAVGDDRILVQLPGLDEKQREEARRTLERTAFLEFRLVHEDNERLLAESVTDPKFTEPVGYTKMTIKEVRNGVPTERSYYVKKAREMTGKNVSRAYVDYDQIGRPYVAMNFDSEGAALFGRITTANVGRQLAIILDGELYSAPVIQEPITGGNCQITGDFSISVATQLANVLENPLEAPVSIVEERGVDPSLGKDSIQSGVQATIIGSSAVIVFMIIFYMRAGVISVLAVLLNMLLLLGGLAAFKFTLTLPGLAGIVLTVGMAVDASVLIFERIREELAAAKTLRAAIVAGFQRAFIVIFDSNFTTILTALILIWLGSGPVQGFGVTLTLGLIANLIAAVFATRLIFDWMLNQGWITSFKTIKILGNTAINFLGIRRIAFGISWALIIVGMVVFFQRGGGQVGKGAVYGIDFTGGDMLAIKFAQKVDSTAIRQTLERNGITDALIQYQSEHAGGDEVLTLKLPEGASEKVTDALQGAFPQSGMTVIGTDRVGAGISKELLRQGVYALLLAILGIAIYIAFRFGEMAYGLGAVVALVHDVLMCIAWFCLTGRTFSLPVVAAILTIIGYSINDTIVVFDRIRENRRLSGGKIHYFDLINQSINQTLSRTLLTAGTTLISALALYIFGGRVINDFAFMFTVGVITGTFSSIYIASPIVLWWHRHEGRPKAATRKPEPVKA
jgi:SecD/SecF fusion protein